MKLKAWNDIFKRFMLLGKWLLSKTKWETVVVSNEGGPHIIYNEDSGRPKPSEIYLELLSLKWENWKSWNLLQIGTWDISASGLKVLFASWVTWCTTASLSVTIIWPDTKCLIHTDHSRILKTRIPPQKNLLSTLRSLITETWRIHWKNTRIPLKLEFCLYKTMHWSTILGQTKY